MSIFKGWRTVVINALLMVPLLFEVAMQIFVSPEFGALISDEHKDLYGLAIVIVNIYLRSITNTAIGRSR